MGVGMEVRLVAGAGVGNCSWGGAWVKVCFQCSPLSYILD